MLLTRPPLDNVSSGRSFPIRISFDLHVLGTPPAFILSQDQTLIKSVCLRQNKLTFIISCLFRYQPAKVDNFYCLFRCISITTHTRSFEFSRLSHYLIIKVLSHFVASQQVSFDILSYDFASVKNFFKFSILAKSTEKQGFEPWRRFSRPTPFPGEPLQPLGYFSKAYT